MNPSIPNPPALLGTLGPTPDLLGDLPETPYALNVAVVYQDLLTREWAAQVCDHAASLVGSESIHSTWWGLSRFHDPRVLADAAVEALQADLVIVSVYDNGEWPAALDAWLVAWLPHRRLPAAALVALLGVADQPATRHRRVAEQLQRTAHTHGLEFFLREHPAPPAQLPASVAARSAPGDDPGRPACRHWGINE